MHLTSMTIKNFKGIDEHGVRIDFAPITMLFGPNNAGKSTIIQAMHLAREVLCRNNADTDTVEGGGSGISLGGFRDYVHKHEEHREVSLRFDVKVDTLPIYWNEYEQELYHDVAYEAQDLLYNVNSVGVELGIKFGELSSYTIYINGNAFSQLQFGGNICIFNGCMVVHILEEDVQEEIRKEGKKAWAAIDANSDDYSNTILDVEENILARIPPLLQPFVTKNSFDCVDFPEIHDENHVYCSPIVGAQDGSVYMFLDEGKPLNFDDASLFRAASWLTAEEHADEGSELVAALAVVRPLLLASLILGPGKLLRDELNRLMYIGPLRQVPPRGYIPCKYSDLERWPEGLAAWDIVADPKNDQRDQINSWLHGPGSLETGYTVQNRVFNEFNSKAWAAVDYILRNNFDEEQIPVIPALLRSQRQHFEWFLRNEATGVAVHPRDMGTGISQIMPVVVAGALAKPGSIIAIEQPELHIHPRLQVVLGDLFIKAVAGHDRPPMFLLETHSEHLLLRLLRRIRETSEGELPEEFPDVTPKDVAVLYVQPSADGGTEVVQLPITPDGDFSRKWPHGFFAERAEELF